MTEAKQDKTEQYLQLARDAFQQKDYDTATDHLISVLQIDSSNSDAFGIMGDVAFSKKDLDTAEGYYLRRVELAPQSYEAHEDLGLLYMERCEYENAIKEFETALQFCNEHATHICTWHPSIIVSDNMMKHTNGSTGRSLNSKPKSHSPRENCTTRLTVEFPAPSARTCQSTSLTT
jgi:Tfp pilus assembly protein PilF